MVFFERTPTSGTFAHFAFHSFKKHAYLDFFLRYKFFLDCLPFHFFFSRVSSRISGFFFSPCRHHLFNFPFSSRFPSLYRRQCPLELRREFIFPSNKRLRSFGLFPSVFFFPTKLEVFFCFLQVCRRIPLPEPLDHFFAPLPLSSLSYISGRHVLPPSTPVDSTISRHGSFTRPLCFPTTFHPFRAFSSVQPHAKVYGHHADPDFFSPRYVFLLRTFLTAPVAQSPFLVLVPDRRTLFLSPFFSPILWPGGVFSELRKKSFLEFPFAPPSGSFTFSCFLPFLFPVLLVKRKHCRFSLLCLLPVPNIGCSPFPRPLAQFRAAYAF